MLIYSGVDNVLCKWVSDTKWKWVGILCFLGCGACWTSRILCTSWYDTWSSLYESDHQMITKRNPDNDSESISNQYTPIIHNIKRSTATAPAPKQTQTALIVIVIQCRSRHYSWTHRPRPNQSSSIRGVETQRSAVCIGNQSGWSRGCAHKTESAGFGGLFLMNCGCGESEAFYQYEYRYKIQNIRWQSAKCRVSISNTVEYCMQRKRVQPDTMGSRNSWRGDARPRTVRQALPSRAQPHLLLFLPYCFWCVSVRYIYTLQVWVFLRTPYSVWVWIELMPIDAFSYFSCSHVLCIWPLPTGLNRNSFFTPNPDSSTTTFLNHPICLACHLLLPSKAGESTLWSETKWHLPPLWGCLSTVLYCTLYSHTCSYSCRGGAVFLWIHTEFHPGRPVSGPIQAHSGWTILPVDSSFSRIFFATPHRWAGSPVLPLPYVYFMGKWSPW